ncbi:MAG: phosphatase PAP2 family protein [Haliscomenobacter sp.]|nr:phosphatase PAP2 family protein [Haliscomenobacter sp.]MBP9075576.1 phosphatase PAP2 family protein [Haliscomenobacter sp.]
MTVKSAFSWKSFVSDNRMFFLAWVLFSLAGIGWLIAMPKGELLFFFSGHRSAFGNAFFRMWTKGGETEGFLIVLAVLLGVRYRWALAFPLLTAGVSLSSNLTKAWFRQPRPGRYFQELGRMDGIVPVPGVQIHEGMTSMPSGHTMAAFAFFAFLAFCLPEKRVSGFFLFAAAALVGLSRIYLVLHFEEDVLAGAAMGVGLAALFYYLFLPKKEAQASRLDSNLIADWRKRRRFSSGEKFPS